MITLGKILDGAVFIQLTIHEDFNDIGLHKRTNVLWRFTTGRDIIFRNRKLKIDI